MKRKPASTDPAHSANAGARPGHMRDRCGTARSEEELLLRIAERDSGAFAELFDRAAPRLLGLLVRMLHSRPDADDVLQDVFCQIWARAGQFDASRSSALIWLTLIARCRARDYCRRKRRPVAVVASDASAPDVAIEVDSADERQKARRALAQLPQEQREAIGLAFFDGLTHEQISQRSALPLGTVKTRIRRGMVRLREILAGNRQAVAQ